MRHKSMLYPSDRCSSIPCKRPVTCWMDVAITDEHADGTVEKRETRLCFCTRHGQQYYDAMDAKLGVVSTTWPNGEKQTVRDLGGIRP